MDERAPPIRCKWQDNRERGDGYSRLDLELANVAGIRVVKNPLTGRA